jgi:hypothetical protein
MSRNLMISSHFGALLFVRAAGLALVALGAETLASAGGSFLVSRPFLGRLYDSSYLWKQFANNAVPAAAMLAAGLYLLFGARWAIRAIASCSTSLPRPPAPVGSPP